MFLWLPPILPYSSIGCCFAVSTFFQEGGDIGADVVEMFSGLLDVFLQEILTGQAVSCKGAVEHPQLITEDFDLHRKEKNNTFLLTVLDDTTIILLNSHVVI